MSKTILAQVDGFTPLMDGVVADVGVISAAVFGKAWRYCQMADGVCKAGQERIANELGLSRATVNAHLKKLCDARYLRDTTPDLVGLPHIYADTGKANLSISLTGTTTTCQKDLQPPVKKIDTKKVIKKQDNNETETPSTDVPPARFSQQEIDSNYGVLVTLYYQNLTGMIVPVLQEKMQDVARLYPPELYAPAFAAAVTQNARNWAYVQKCIENAATGNEPPKRTPYTPRKPQAVIVPAPVTHDVHGIPESW